MQGRILAAVIAVFIAATALASEFRVAASDAVDVRVIDGDTFDLQGTRVRLLHMDAPEAGQRCTDAAGRSYDCGGQATAALRLMLDGARIACAQEGTDAYVRVLAFCTANGRDIGAAMVASGHAVAFRRYGDTYIAQERSAARERRGLWSGAFVTPGAHRAGAEKETTVGLGTKGCAIKGNISARGDRIYHVPGSRSYAKTRINPLKGEKWFCTEAEARALGWRAPRG